MNKPKDFEVYSYGLVFASICSTLGVNQTVDRINEELPTGISSGWHLSDENFATGEPNPHPCNQNPKTHKHYLVNC